MWSLFALIDSYHTVAFVLHGAIKFEVRCPDLDASNGVSNVEIRHFGTYFKRIRDLFSSYGRGT